MRVAVQDGEREVLLNELEGIVELAFGLYGQIGREWDREDAPSLPDDLAPFVRARDQLAGDRPWQIEGSATELEFLLGRLRAGAELALQRGAQPSPARRSVAMNTSDAEGTDAQLDILHVCDALAQRIGGSGPGQPQ